MEPPILSDPNQYPSEDVIFPNIGKTKALWIPLFEHIHANHPDFAEEWRYYRDGKSWLLKVTRKKQTIFWLSIIRDSFRTTFYFNAKAEKLIQESDISNDLKEQYRNGMKNNRIQGLTITYANKNDIEEAKKLMKLKISMK